MTGRSSDTETLRRVRLWDPFVRVFHWALAACVITTWLWGQINPTGFLTLHFYLGYTIIGLLAFRVIWGVFGAWPARFRDFIYAPGTVIRYMRGLGQREPSRWPGHNPIGAASVYLLLGVLMLQAYTGLYTDPDDFINAGPLVADAPAGRVPWATNMHQTLAPIILLLFLLHVSANLYYLFWKREDLISPMFHGRKIVKGEVPEERVIEEVVDTDRA